MQRYKDKSGNKIYVEGSIAEAYIIDESILWCIEYMENPALGTHKGTHETFIDEEDEYADEGPLLYGKEITLTHLQFAQVRKWVLKHYDEADEYRKVETQLDGFQNELTDVNQALNILVQAHLGKTQNISKSVNKGGSNSSSSVANTPQQENLALCKLLDFDGNEVVHGRVVTDSSSRMCHFRVLQAHEANVLLEEVMIGEACLYKAPQNEKMTIQEIEIGSYLVWNKHLLKFD